MHALGLPGTSLLPSVNFLLVALVFCGTGSLLWHGFVWGQGAVLVFVVAGWIVSLCLHEFAHALVAHGGGDRSVAATGYLSLDPLRYTDPLLSLLLPLVYIVIGGFGLPGGAVWIDHAAIRSAWWDAAVSAAAAEMMASCCMDGFQIDGSAARSPRSVEVGARLDECHDAKAIEQQPPHPGRSPRPLRRKAGG